jgi:hypothetical protein
MMQVAAALLLWILVTAGAIALAFAWTAGV